jgi:gag-polypeptide of LTR copia-type
MDILSKGALQMRMHENIVTQISSHTSLKDMWDALKTLYGSPGLAAIFADFKKAIQMRIGSGDPRPAIAKLQNYFGTLGNNGVSLDKFIKAMILISTLPSKYDNTVAILLNKEKSELNFSTVSKAVQAEYDRVANPATLSKFTSIKKKGGNPNFRQQQGKPKDSANNGNSQDKGKGHGSKGGNKKKEKERKKKDQGHSHSHGSSHMVSAIILGNHLISLAPQEYVPPQANVLVLSFTKTGPSIDKRPVDLTPSTHLPASAAKAKSAPSTETSKYPGVGKARKHCGTLNLPKTPRNLKVFEGLEKGKRVLADRLSSPLPRPSKRQRHFSRP